MSITDTLLIFVGGFASVFTLGFQSRAVNGGNFGLAAAMSFVVAAAMSFVVAAAMSFVVAMSQAHLWGMIVDADGSLLSTVVYGLSGSCAITAAMYCHKRFFPAEPKSD